MTEKNTADTNAGNKGNKFLGSLREALRAGRREGDRPIEVGTETNIQSKSTNDKVTATAMRSENPARKGQTTPPPLPSAAEAAREARGGTPNVPPVNDNLKPAKQVAPPITGALKPDGQPIATVEPHTQLIRGHQTVERGEFGQDPVVGWLVIVGGPGIGAFRPVFEGNNAVGRSATNRIPIDFGDDAISGKEQAYIRYDSTDRSFLLVPNMSKTNIVSVNDERPTSAVILHSMDVIAMGHTQLVFVPFCGPEFDWDALSNLKAEN